MDILAAVDGTGPYSDAEYQQNFATSFVRTMYSNWHTAHKYYDRGPGLDGTSTGARAKAMAGRASDFYKSSLFGKTTSVVPRIFLTGYSRGGAAALEAANTLTNMGIPVHALLLFDAVDRSITVSNTTVPHGVRHCRHAIRSSATNSRTTFGNVGRQRHESVDFPHTVSFHCTHGAMGGTPWSEAGPDGFIREWDEGSTSKTSQLIKSAGRISPIGTIGAYVGSEVLDQAVKTNVTLAQERANGLRVFSYMFGQLELLKKRE